MNCLFGFKLYLIINDKEEILNFMFTSGNADEREPLKQSKFLENIKGKLCVDKGYIGQNLFNLFEVFSFFLGQDSGEDGEIVAGSITCRFCKM